MSQEMLRGSSRAVDSINALHGQRSSADHGLQVVQIRLVPERVLYSERPITNTRELYRVVAKELKTLDRETFCAVSLSSKNVPISLTFCSMGTIDNTIVAPREVFKSAILSNAASVIVAHNHPSSECTPSYEDVEATRRLIACGELMGISVLDHVIVGAYTGEYFSFREHDLMTSGELTRYLGNMEKTDSFLGIASEANGQKPDQTAKKTTSKRKKTR